MQSTQKNFLEDACKLIAQRMAATEHPQKPTNE